MKEDFSSLPTKGMKDCVWGFGHHRGEVEKGVVKRGKGGVEAYS